MAFSLSKQSKAIILVVGDVEVTLLTWFRQSLSQHAVLRDNPRDHELFANFLVAHAGYRVILVTDLVEESFRHESVVHVSAADRQAMLQRKLNYSFRNTPYRTVRVISREKTGRRDDNIMMSGVTKPELVAPWVRMVLERNMSIQAITSVAYLLEHYVASWKLQVPEHLLLVSLEENASLRQTYLRNGRVLFSRLANLIPGDTAQIAGEVYQESLHIKNYLERVRLLPYDSQLQVQVYSGLDRFELASRLVSSETTRFDCFDLRAEAGRYQRHLNQVKPQSTTLLLAHVLSRRPVQNLYANFQARRYGLLRRGAAMASAASILLLLGAALFNVPRFADIYDFRQQQQQLLAITLPLQREYRELTQRFPQTPIPSKEMELVVQTAERIEAQTYLPSDTLDMIGQALAESPGLQITEIVWRLVEVPPDFERPFGWRPPADVTRSNQFLFAVVESRTQLRIEINGMAYSPNSFRDAQNQVMALANALETNPGVSVQATKLPTDVRSDTSVVTTVNDSELRASFSLEVALQGAG